jgi:hypothetical protein
LDRILAHSISAQPSSTAPIIKGTHPQTTGKINKTMATDKLSSSCLLLRETPDKTNGNHADNQHSGKNYKYPSG